jgi:hypothetical protein
VLRFSAERSGWAFDERLDVAVHRPAAGYHGELSFERAGLHFAAGENLTVRVVQADWHGVLFGDWRGMHAAVWAAELCGVPQPFG